MNQNLEAQKSVVSIQNFCDIYSISRAKFYLLLAEGKAPKTFKIGRRRYISMDSARNWLKQLEEENNG